MGSIIGAMYAAGLSEEEMEAKESEPILQDVFGGDESLAARYEVQKSVSYGRARITLLRPAVSEV